MTDEQKYMEILKACGELLAENNRAISLADYRIKTLTEKLEAAEATIAELKKRKLEAIEATMDELTKGKSDGK